MKARRGSALIEFAVAMAIVTPVFVGAVQFFGAYSVVGNVQQATIEGAQAAASLPYDSASEATPPAFRRAVEDAVLRSAIPGLRREHIRVAMRFDRGRPSEVEVSISGFGIAAPGGPISLNGRPRAVFPYRGHWPAAAE